MKTLSELVEALRSAGLPVVVVRHSEGHAPEVVLADDASAAQRRLADDLARRFAPDGDAPTADARARLFAARGQALELHQLPALVADLVWVVTHGR